MDKLADISSIAGKRVQGVISIVLLLLVLASQGCGYTRIEVFPSDVRTVAVPIFDNRSFYRGTEFDLTEALVKEIERRTPYKVIDPKQADTIIHGSIAAVHQHQVSKVRRGGVPQELEVSIVIHFEWEDLRSGKTIRERRGFEVVGRHIPAHPVREPFEVAQHQAVQEVARRIVTIMAADW